MTTEQKQQLAKDLYSIDWVAIQTDCVHENEKLKFILYQIEKLVPTEQVRLMLQVLEATQLKLRFAHQEKHPFDDMHDFKYIDSYLKGYSTEDYKKLEKQKLFPISPGYKDFQVRKDMFTFKDGSFFGDNNNRKLLD